jgi:hypothetical protein
MRSTALALLLAAGAATAGVAVSGARPVPAPIAAHAAASGAVGSQETQPPVVCGFRNPSYAGLCEERTPYVQGKKLEALCRPILDCLNDTRCIKTYCGATTIRQGWVLESATREK